MRSQYFGDEILTICIGNAYETKLLTQREGSKQRSDRIAIIFKNPVSITHLGKVHGLHPASCFLRSK